MGTAEDFPSLVAVIAAVPAPTADTSPPVSTRATCALELDHATARPASVRPRESTGDAVMRACVPAYNVRFVCESLTDATGIGTTVKEMLVCWLSAYAAIFTCPGLRVLICAPVVVGKTRA